MKLIGMLVISLACTVGCKSWMLSQLVINHKYFQLFFRIANKDQVKFKQHLDLSSLRAWFITDKHPYSFHMGVTQESYPLVISKNESLYASLVAHQAGADLGFCSMKGLGVFLLPPGWDASPSQGYPQAVNSPVPIYTPGWREALRE